MTTTKFIHASIAASLLMSMALPALAQTATNTAVPAPTTPSTQTTPKLDTACMQNAIGKRDTALISVVDTYATAVKNALQTRSDALKAAWGISDAKARRAAVKTAWKAYQTAQSANRRALVAGRKGVWNQFYADRKQCGKGAATEDTGTEGMDAGL